MPLIKVTWFESDCLEFNDNDIKYEKFNYLEKHTLYFGNMIAAGIWMKHHTDQYVSSGAPKFHVKVINEDDLMFKYNEIEENVKAISEDIPEQIKPEKKKHKPN
jgi:hypothetical protein